MPACEAQVYAVNGLSLFVSSLDTSCEASIIGNATNHHVALRCYEQSTKTAREWLTVTLTCRPDTARNCVTYLAANEVSAEFIGSNWDFEGCPWCTHGHLYISHIYTVGDCKVHVQRLAEVKLQALKQIWLQGHCNNRHM